MIARKIPRAAMLFAAVLALMVLASCKMKITMTLPNVFYGKWYRFNEKDECTRCLILDKGGKFQLTEYGYTPSKVTKGEYEYSYGSFHVTDASGVITFDDGSTYSFVWEASAEDGPLSLSLVQKGDDGKEIKKAAHLYEYYGEATLVDDTPEGDAPATPDGSAPTGDGGTPTGDGGAPTGGGA